MKKKDLFRVGWYREDSEKKSTLDKEVKRPKDLRMNRGTKSGTMKTEGEEFVLFVPPPPCVCPRSQNAR